MGGCAPQPATPASAARPKRDEWQRVRDQFDVSRDWVHMSGFLLASHPKPVRDAIEAYRRGLDADPAQYFEAHQGVPKADRASSEPGAEELVRMAAALYLGAAASEIALTDSTTMGLGTIYCGLPLDVGDEIVTTEHDHYSTHEALRLAALRTGATMRKARLYDRGESAAAEPMVRALIAALSPATKLVAVTWVHSSTGVKLPLRAMADAIADVNASRHPARRILFCVDAVHGLGVEDETMASLGCDFFIAGCHKWLFGPRGTGIVWGKPEHWPLLRPTIPHFGNDGFLAWLADKPPPPTSADMMTPGGFHSFEHRWALGEAFAFHMQIGKAKVKERIHALSRQCKEGLAVMRNVTLHTPREDDVSAGIITFEVAGLPPELAVQRLHEARIVATPTPYRESYVRVAPGLLCSEEDVEAVLRSVRSMV
ncbi:MAG: aminotransferase class V-fold PLP-dependent enzyme [Polyangiaceae bacterium]|nr:aminotransferase class V-fold PLP-dependent enzyme [Polyangiaceae bacterium]